MATSDNTQIWLDVLRIVIPALVIVSGGVFTYWRYLRKAAQEQTVKKEEQEEKDSRIKLEAEEAAWQRAKDAMAQDSKRIEKLESRLEKLENKFESCDEERDLLRRQNKLLAEENTALKEENIILKELVEEIRNGK